MRVGSLVLAASLVAGCEVPSVTYYEADASDASIVRPDASVRDTGAAADDASSEGDTPQYCVGPDGGVPPPNGLACCPGGHGEACAGQCQSKACQACEQSGPCTWPNGVCCTTGANGVCRPYC